MCAGVSDHVDEELDPHVEAPADDDQQYDHSEHGGQDDQLESREEEENYDNDDNGDNDDWSTVIRVSEFLEKGTVR